MPQLIPSSFNLGFLLDVYRRRLNIGDIELQKISDLPEGYLEEHDITKLLFDADNTLYPYHEYNIIDPAIDDMLMKLAKRYNIAILSNNNNPENKKKLIDCFAKYCATRNLRPFYIADCSIKKPSPEPYLDAMAAIHALPQNTAMFGDMDLTDIAGANLLGILTIKVEPINISSEPSYFKPARYVERLIRYYQAKNGII